MADKFYREPTNHGDNNDWYDYIMFQTRCGGRGGLTMELYLSAGYAGIDDGVMKGTVERTLAGALSIAAVSVSNWCKVEVSVSGAAVTYTVSAVAGGTDEGTIPATIKAAYDYLKGGYYLTASKRIVGVAWKTAAGALGRIVNCESGRFGFRNVAMIRHRTGAGVESLTYWATRVVEIGDWDMDTTETLNVAHGMVGWKGIRTVTVEIRRDDESEYHQLPMNRNTDFLCEGIQYGLDTTNVSLKRLTGGDFDDINYSATSFNRGWITIEYET